SRFLPGAFLHAELRSAFAKTLLEGPAAANHGYTGDDAERLPAFCAFEVFCLFFNQKTARQMGRLPAPKKKHKKNQHVMLIASSGTPLEKHRVSERSHARRETGRPREKTGSQAGLKWRQAECPTSKPGPGLAGASWAPLPFPSGFWRAPEAHSRRKKRLCSIPATPPGCSRPPPSCFS